MKTKIKKKYVQQLIEKYYNTYDFLNKKNNFYTFKFISKISIISFILVLTFCSIGIYLNPPISNNKITFNILTIIGFFILLFDMALSNYLENKKNKIFKSFTILKNNDKTIDLSKINPDEIILKCKILKNIKKNEKNNNIKIFQYVKFQKRCKKYIIILKEIENYINSLEGRK